MKLRSNLVILFACALSNMAVAQILPFWRAERPVEGWPAEQEVSYQPVVTDTSLLFPTPWLVWQCTCGWPIDYEVYYDVDWRTVRMCWGRKEVFDRVAVNGQYSFVQRGLGELHAMLEENGDGFLYKELAGDDAEPTRVVQLNFDMDHVLRTDTAAVTRWDREGLITRITHYVALERTP